MGCRDDPGLLRSEGPSAIIDRSFRLGCTGDLAAREEGRELLALELVFAAFRGDCGRTERVGGDLGVGLAIACRRGDFVGLVGEA